MALLGWMKNRDVRTVWSSGPYTDRDTGYLARACVGLSDRGYHPGLIIMPPGEDPETSWGNPMARRDYAMAAAYGSYECWVSGHEAEKDMKRQPKRAGNMIERHPPSWER